MRPQTQLMARAYMVAQEDGHLITSQEWIDVSPGIYSIVPLSAAHHSHLKSSDLT